MVDVLYFGVGIAVLAQLFFLLGDAMDKIELDRIPGHLVKVCFGLILFAFADKTIKDIDTKEQVETNGTVDIPGGS